MGQVEALQADAAPLAFLQRAKADRTDGQPLQIAHGMAELFGRAPDLSIAALSHLHFQQGGLAVLSQRPHHHRCAGQRCRVSAEGCPSTHTR